MAELSASDGALALGAIRARIGYHENKYYQAHFGGHSLHDAICQRLQPWRGGCRPRADVAGGNAKGRAAPTRNSRIRLVAKEVRRRGRSSQVKIERVAKT